MPPRRHPGSMGRYHLLMAEKALTYGTYLKVPQLLELQ